MAGMQGEARSDDDDVRAARARVEARVRGAFAKGAFEEGVTEALRAYGPEVLGFLVATMRDEADADDVFAQLCEDVWRGAPSFRGDASIRTWLYVLARNAAHRFRRDPLRRRGAALSDCAAVSAIEAEVRERTRSYLRSEVRDRVARLREALDPDDRMLLVLRVDRGMSFREIAKVFADASGGPEGEDKRREAALRKRYERVKERIRELARTDAGTR